LLFLSTFKSSLGVVSFLICFISQPNLSRVEQFIQAVGSFEDKIFQKRARLHQRQSERIKREKAQARRRDDVEPQVQPESLVPVARFHGSRLASGPSPSPYQQSGFKHSSESSTSVRKDYQLGQATAGLSELEIKSKQSWASERRGASAQPNKVARLSSGATIGAAIVEAENNLEIDVCFPASGEAL
jgi:5'-3' exoribonuclease 2